MKERFMSYDTIVCNERYIHIHTYKQRYTICYKIIYKLISTSIYSSTLRPICFL